MRFLPLILAASFLPILAMGQVGTPHPTNKKLMCYPAGKKGQKCFPRFQEKVEMKKRYIDLGFFYEKVQLKDQIKKVKLLRTSDTPKVVRFYIDYEGLEFACLQSGYRPNYGRPYYRPPPYGYYPRRGRYYGGRPYYRRPQRQRVCVRKGYIPVAKYYTVKVNFRNARRLKVGETEAYNLIVRGLHDRKEAQNAGLEKLELLAKPNLNYKVDLKHKASNKKTKFWVE